MVSIKKDLCEDLIKEPWSLILLLMFGLDTLFLNEHAQLKK